MAAYKDEKRGTWYVSFHYYDWTGKNCRKVKRGFKTKRDATEWERHFRMKEAADLDMTFGEFVEAYTRDMKPKLKHNTWLTKEHILRTKLLPYFKDKKMRDIRVILSRLVDTFISRISLTMLPVPNPHNTVCVLSWEEARHWQSRSSGYSSS